MHAMIRPACLLFALLLAPQAPALAPAGDETFKSSGYSVDDFCLFVAENVRAESAPQFVFVYRLALFKAAGVDPGRDDAPAVRRKMAAWWGRHRKTLICNVANSVVRNGNVLKLAVDRSSTDFLTDAVRRWKLDVNQVDADGTTVLDFVDSQIASSSSADRQDTLKRYRNWLLQAGGKHARELR
jgi:hypothetical protein